MTTQNRRQFHVPLRTGNGRKDIARLLLAGHLAMMIFWFGELVQVLPNSEGTPIAIQTLGLVGLILCAWGGLSIGYVLERLGGKQFLWIPALGLPIILVLPTPGLTPIFYVSWILYLVALALHPHPWWGPLDIKNLDGEARTRSFE